MLNRNFVTPPPVERIELTEGNTRRRGLAVVLLLVIAMAAFGFGIFRATSHRGGWTEISAREGSPGCAREFSFRYCLDEKNSTAQYRLLTGLYSAATERAAQVYSTEDCGEVGNLFLLNTHPNEAVTIEPELYAALEKVVRHQNRVLYLAPLYEIYTSLFFCTTDEETASFDPLQNRELSAEFAELAAFANDARHIDLELLGDNRVRLYVSEEYGRFLADNGYTHLVDFSWMKNAFIVDDLCQALRAQGFSHGFLQSADGFGANLCETGETFAMNLFDGTAAGVGLVAQMEYAKPIGFCALRRYSLNPTDSDWYYELENGEVRSLFLDPQDGQPKTALSDLLLWSSELSCGELVLRACPVFLSDSFDPARLDSDGLYAAYCEDKTIVCTDGEMNIALVAQGYRVSREG